MLNKGSLSGVRVLVTRPRHQAQSLCQAIIQAGGEALALPLLEITAPQSLAPLQRLQAQWAQVDLLIFISPNAVMQGYHYLSFPSAIPRAAIGPSTARALEERGFPATWVAGAPYNSEALLALPAFQPLRYHKIVIVRGEGGREYLRQQLEARGAAVTYAEVYRRCQPVVRVERLRELAVAIDIVILTSLEILAHWVELCQSAPDLPGLKALPCIVVSSRMVMQAQAAGFSNLLLAENAQDQALLTAVQQWQQGKGKTCVNPV